VRHWRRCVGLLALLTAAGCGSGDREPDLPRDPAARRAAGAMIVALQDDGKTLDPHKAADAASMHLIENLYSTLLRYSVQYGEVEADLAERYDVSPDGRSYTFRLRPNAVFHSGRPVTAEDVRFSIDRIRQLQVRAAQFTAVEAIETPDAHTVVFRLREPFAPLVTYLAHPMNAIVDRDVVAANGGNLDRADAGSGPFALVEWRKDQRMLLRRNDQYYIPGLPRLARVAFVPMPDATARTVSLRTGEIDLLLDVTGRDEKVLRPLQHLAVQSVPGTFWEYVGINTTRKLLDDVRVRQAIAWAVDRDAINRVVKLNAATLLDGGLIPPGHWAHADLRLYPRHDPARARALLESAGVRPGELSLVMKVGSAFPYQVAAGQMVKQQLREVGIDVQLLSQESGVFFEALGQKDFDLTVCGWVGFVDPDEWTYELFHSTGKWNQQGYRNPQVDTLLEQGRRTTARETRKQVYAEAQRLIAEDAPMVFLYANDQASAALPSVAGFNAHPTASTIFLRNASFSNTPAAIAAASPEPGRAVRP
jgi:peptide/nickel transport system substrate-binding protein